ncbi:MAG: hypothetical protein PHD56_07785 [Anaerostipes sp.]|nr:hypothetical protein [Anaerostipes sp.]
MLELVRYAISGFVILSITVSVIDLVKSFMSYRIIKSHGVDLDIGDVEESGADGRE